MHSSKARFIWIIFKQEQQTKTTHTLQAALKLVIQIEHDHERTIGLRALARWGPRMRSHLLVTLITEENTPRFRAQKIVF